MLLERQTPIRHKHTEYISPHWGKEPDQTERSAPKRLQTVVKKKERKNGENRNRNRIEEG